MIIQKLKYYIYYLTKFILNDYLFIKLKYFLHHKRLPNLNTPKTFNERIAYFKLNNRSDFYTVLADKYKVKDYVIDKIGQKYVLKNLYVTSNPSTIKFEKLPDSFIIKASHGSSASIIIRDKNKIDKKSIVNQCNHFLSMNYYYWGREFHARNIPPRIIIEELMLDSNGKIPLDYKFFTFNGEVKAIQVDINRFFNQKRNFYTIGWKKMNVELLHPQYDGEIEKPAKLEKMIDIARKLSDNLEFARIDLYFHMDKIYFGEITLTPGNNLEKFNPIGYDRIFGDFYNIKQIK